MGAGAIEAGRRRRVEGRRGLAAASSVRITLTGAALAPAAAMLASSLSPTPMTPAPSPMTAVTAVTAEVPDAPAVTSDWGTNESCVNHDNGPIAIRRRPIEMFRNARTTVGSNWLPAQRANSARAAAADTGCLYDCADVITSNASATATMRAARLMSSPANRRG